MNPYPLVGLNHFTVPVAIVVSLLLCVPIRACAHSSVPHSIGVLGIDLRAAQCRGAVQGRPKARYRDLYDRNWVGSMYFPPHMAAAGFAPAPPCVTLNGP